MTDDVVIERRLPAVQSWATGRHWPKPVRKADCWRCGDCGRRLSRYRSTARDEVRLRHNPRDRG